MKYIYFDASAGLSGDMILAALLDLGVSKKAFEKVMAGLGLPVEIRTKEVKRAGLRGLKVEVCVKKGKESAARHWDDVETLIQKSPFSELVKSMALSAFKILFEAEAKVHGTRFREVHLHEAGADDAIVDVAGSCYLREKLDIAKVYCSPLNVGRGWVKAAHGRLPVPPPAVAEILRKVPVYSAWAEAELVTPTGAAIIAAWADKFVPFPEISYDKIGYGAGSRELEGLPNILRAFYGRLPGLHAETAIYQIEANVDDANPQLLAHFLDIALELGALDVYLTPIVMKKGRLANLLTVLAGRDKVDQLIETIFAETTSIGVRYFPVERRILAREICQVELWGERISVKTAALGGIEVNAQPEFADCLRVARKKKIPVKKVCQLALKEYLEQAESRRKE